MTPTIRWLGASINPGAIQFGENVADTEISNGARMHQVARYLTAAETGAAIAGALGSRTAGRGG